MQLAQHEIMTSVFVYIKQNCQVYSSFYMTDLGNRARKIQVMGIMLFGKSHFNKLYLVSRRPIADGIAEFLVRIGLQCTERRKRNTL